MHDHEHSHNTLGGERRGPGLAAEGMLPPADCLYPLIELAARPWMPRKNGRPIHISTLLRWAFRGKRGVRLQTLMVGGCRCTCDAWAMEFFRRLTSSPGVSAPTAQKSRQLAHVEQQLEEAGL